MTKSIIDSKITNKEVIWVSFDIETGGPQCGILQLSAVFYDCDGAQLGELGEHCRPPLGAKFLPQARQCHGMMPRGGPSLASAKAVKDVVDGADVVVSTLGHVPGDAPMMTSAVMNILAAAREQAAPAGGKTGEI